MSEIVLGGGCFWCVEAVFRQVSGVKDVISGYAGGDSENPTYKDICKGDTNHAEVVKVIFKDDKISLEKLLDIFFTIHDPTTLNRQGNDMGTQYRSIVFYEDNSQKEIVEKSILKAQKRYEKKIVTKVEKLPTFYKAEEYHQDYFRKNPTDGYCNFAIPPKLEKLKRFACKSFTCKHNSIYSSLLLQLRRLV